MSAGHTLRDLRAALAVWQNERREELGFELDEVESATVLGAANELGNELTRLGSAQREVDDIARSSWMHLTPPTPV